jgi:DeoR/GlpR family transcriptional regulator of sugar metabolism
MIAAERLRRIGQMLRSEQVVSTAKLSETLEVSKMTIRRDFRHLEKMGLCRLTHGGAVAVGGTLVDDIPYSRRAQMYVEEKRAIGLRAASMVEEGETIAIDGGTTTSCMAAALRDRRDITIITNSLRVLNELSEARGLTVISTGGTMSTAFYERPGHADPCLVGPLAEMNMHRFRPSKAFMATTGLSIADGLSNGVVDQATMKQVMIESSREIILLADHSKFGQVASSIVGPLTLVDRIVTDVGVPLESRRAVESLGIEVIVVDPLKETTLLSGV